MRLFSDRFSEGLKVREGIFSGGGSIVGVYSPCCIRILQSSTQLICLVGTEIVCFHERSIH